MQVVWKNMIRISCMILLTFVVMGRPVDSFSQPSETRMLDNVWIEKLDGEYLVHISFVYPIQYLTHFPQGTGDELRISLRPFVLGTADLGIENNRESIRPRSEDNVDLIEIAYEGNFSDSHFLILNFKQIHRFEVQTGQDSRSLLVLVKPETSLQ